MIGLRPLLALLMGVAHLAADPLATPQVRVRVMESFHPGEVELSGANGVMFTSWPLGEKVEAQPREKAWLRCRSGEGVCLRAGKMQTCRPTWIAETVRAEDPIAVAVQGVAERSYYGKLEVMVAKEECRVINTLELERYVESVTCSEMAGAPRQAQLALAVAVRSWAFSELGRHKSYDFCDLTHCQLYRGADACTAADLEALRAAPGLVLKRNGRVLTAWYFSTCGGHTANAIDIWGMAEEQIDGRPDGDPAFCRHSEHFRWRFEIGRNEMCRALATAGLWRHSPRRGQCLLQVLERGQGGWVRRVRLSAGDEVVELSGEQLRLLMGRNFGWKSVRSAWFEVEMQHDKIVFHGRGFGHGVGLCLQGAIGQAAAGKSFVEILQHYFPAAEVTTR